MWDIWESFQQQWDRLQWRKRQEELHRSSPLPPTSLPNVSDINQPDMNSPQGDPVVDPQQVSILQKWNRGRQAFTYPTYMESGKAFATITGDGTNKSETIDAGNDSRSWQTVCLYEVTAAGVERTPDRDCIVYAADTGEVLTNNIIYNYPGATLPNVRNSLLAFFTGNIPFRYLTLLVYQTHNTPHYYTISGTWIENR